MYQATQLFCWALREKDLTLKNQPQMKLTVGALLEDSVGRDVLAEQGYVDLNITFIDAEAARSKTETDESDSTAAASVTESQDSSEKILEHIPIVRIILKGKPAGI